MISKLRLVKKPGKPCGGEIEEKFRSARKISAYSTLLLTPFVFHEAAKRSEYV
jgi:hypothetical protein